ncbi:hypothetical protein RQP46_008691 [Phenoliferia psychrophenolica]
MLRPIQRALRHPARLLTTRSAQPSAAAWAPWLAGAAAASLLAALTRRPVLLESLASAVPPSVGGVGRPVTAKEIQQHNHAKDAWVVIGGVVYDVTEFLEMHPGGEEVVLPHLGKDISPIFHLLHAKNVLSRTLEDSESLTVVGHLAPGAILEVVESPSSSAAVEERRRNLPPVESIRNCAQFEQHAKEVLGADQREWHFFSSFADDGHSFNANKRSWSYLRFFPRINVPVRSISTATTFLGDPTSIPLPIFYCATGQTTSGHPDGELNLARGSAVTRIPQMVSTLSGISIEEIGEERELLAKNGGSKAPLWWQLYIYTDRKESERRMRDAVKAGVQAIFITVDAPQIGNREADAKPPSSTLMEANLHWRTIKDQAPNMPVLVKGVGCVEDVVLAKQHGADGVLLSNHGTCYGDAGVIHATEILQREVTSGMKLLGVRNLGELKPEMVELLDGLLGRRM